MKKFFLAPRFFVLLALTVFLPGTRAAFDLKVTSTSTNIALGSTITYSITLSNTAITQVQSVQVINAFPTDATVVSAVNSFQSGRVATNSGQIVFSVDILPGTTAANFSLQLRPAQRATFNTSFAAQTLTQTVPSVTTNISATVGLSAVDLGVQVAGFPTNVVVGDEFNYRLTLTNLGPSAATGVNVQSILPAGMNFVSVAPAIPSSFANNLLLLTPGTLANGASTNLVVTLQPRTAGDFNLGTTVVTTENSDSASGNNTATFAIKVLDFVTNRAVIVRASPMVFNRQTGLMDQSVVVSNLTATAIESVRVAATNLVAPNVLYNAIGMNSGNPYVMLPRALPANGSITVNLQYFIPARNPIEVGLVAVEGPNLNPLPRPVGTFQKRRFAASRNSLGILSLIIEAEATVGRTYSLIYVNDLGSTNWVAAQPPVVANSAHVLFTDPGVQEGTRFYGVIEHP